MSFALTVDGVSKSFTKENGKPFKAVDNINLQIKKGTIHGLLGPNGAGKSTLINMISGVLLPDDGKIDLFGVDTVARSNDAKKLLGVVPQEVVVEPALSVDEVLYYFSGMYGVPVKERSGRIAEILDALNLSEKRYEKARTLSGGMKRRLMIAKAILHRPKLLILDEPTAGVDVSLRQKIWGLVRKLNDEGTTILFTTHYLEEAEQLCQAITLINHGKVIKDGKLSDIQREFSRNVIRFELFDHKVEHCDGVKKVSMEYEYPMVHLAKDMTKIVDFYGKNLKSIKNENASLEEIFLTLTHD